ncbi:FadR/GntR family transcriptional regulator [Leucobacter sp. NPDC058333]|uniref:FadR/GntR family transcriptional regulator n=1 Tax=Leucobacter sp. NPDC058333 TaxID=3346450 RepID=UPI003655D343
MSIQVPSATPNRLRNAALAPIGDEGRIELVESRIVQAITAGAFTEGERLPSETELSALLGVAVVTVREALSNLRHRGLIETRRGRNGGSFVRLSHGSIEESNARALRLMSRVALADLAVHYEAVCGACAEYACQRATQGELDLVATVLERARGLDRVAWRRRITEVQLELAALSQSVRLTKAHVRVQTEFTPLLALQDIDKQARAATQDALMAQIRATRERNVNGSRNAVRETVRASARWLVSLQADLLAVPHDEDLRATLEARRRER